jgi:hypothetical protein
MFSWDFHRKNPTFQLGYGNKVEIRDFLIRNYNTVKHKRIQTVLSDLSRKVTCPG